ncbi:MAG: rhomboid family intramembrane serine protease [Myxococcota bacterium]
MSFSLEGREAIRFEADGFHHPAAASGSKRVFTRFAALTHVATTPRALWIGAEDSVYVLPRGSFVASEDPERMVQALLSRVTQLPEGAAQLARMSEVEATARLDEREIATWAFAALCVLVYVAQLFHTPWLERVSYFNGAMAAQGDWWRYVTANVFHSYLVHLVLNVAGLVAVGSLVEHALGTARTLFLMIVSGVAAMVVSGLATSVPVVGASGVVSGLVGALLWLELRMTDQLPAWWRVPRRVLFWVIGISAVLSLLPAIAGAAHLGGFVGGIIAMRLVIDRGLGSRASEGWIRGAATAGVVLTAASMATATYHASSADSFLERYGGRVLMTYQLTPYDANEWAWLIATTPDASAEMLENGRQLAEQAVQATDRSEPAILDTLAELHFQLGNAEAAQILIDEAIELEPTNTYYRGQRARFEAGNPEAPLPPANEADGILDLTV